ncbi:hypothetical protein [Rhizosaccharibacter radicis]|uniref:DUF3649 domain-containing protein n=1 Tax=Rhizosaccharibacter radicis TaxID=2782605 RepID=A0ABT1VSN9_9PROT|nr:DUF3649 domain-containing protein [Acetobacteraceae bacterium KSS12]
MASAPIRWFWPARARPTRLATIAPGRAVWRPSRDAAGLGLRLLLGLPGAYGLAALLAYDCATLPPLAAVDGVSLGMLLSFAAWSAAILWSFCAATSIRALLGMAGAAIVLGAASWGLPHQPIVAG